MTPTRVFWIVAGIGAVVLYSLFDPAQVAFLPSCPFHELTGLQCPGCGSQRALHGLLHAEWSAAMRFNPLFVLAIPYLLTGLIMDRFRSSNPTYVKWRRILFGPVASRIVPVVIIGFWILRNVF